MKGLKIWYKLEHFEGEWTIWKYKEGKYSYGSLGIFSSANKKTCLEYCKEKNIRLGKRKAKYE